MLPLSKKIGPFDRNLQTRLFSSNFVKKMIFCCSEWDIILLLGKGKNRVTTTNRENDSKPSSPIQFRWVSIDSRGILNETFTSCERCEAIGSDGNIIASAHPTKSIGICLITLKYFDLLFFLWNECEYAFCKASRGMAEAKKKSNEIKASYVYVSVLVVVSILQIDLFPSARKTNL